MSQKGIDLLEDTFEFQGSCYRYESVQHLGWYAMHTKVTTNFIPTGSYDEARLEVHMKNLSAPIVVNARVTFFPTLRNTEERYRMLFNIYSSLAKKTAQSRLQVYLDQMEERGYFFYSGYRFAENGDIRDVNTDKKLYSLFEDHLYKTANPFQLLIRKRANSVMGELKSKLTAHYISTSIDRDIFYFLFDKLYHLTFDPSEKQKIEVDSTPRPLFDQKPSTFKKCPYCAEKIRAEAIKCKHCGSMLQAE